jgi:hypothetical protein
VLWPLIDEKLETNALCAGTPPWIHRGIVDKSRNIDRIITTVEIQNEMTDLMVRNGVQA